MKSLFVLIFDIVLFLWRYLEIIIDDLIILGYPEGLHGHPQSWYHERYGYVVEGRKYYPTYQVDRTDSGGTYFCYSCQYFLDEYSTLVILQRLLSQIS